MRTRKRYLCGDRIRQAGSPEAQKVLDFFAKEFPKQFDKIRFGTKEKAEKFWAAVGDKNFPSDVKVGVGLKPISYSGAVRLIHSAIGYAIKFNRKSVTLGTIGEHHEVYGRRLPRLGL